VTNRARLGAYNLSGGHEVVKGSKVQVSGENRAKTTMMDSSVLASADMVLDKRECSQQRRGPLQTSAIFSLDHAAPK
jgi:hypothetical protein